MISGAASFVNYPSFSTPMYFSSTHCRANMKATIGPMERIAGAELYLNGIKVDSIGVDVGIWEANPFQIVGPGLAKAELAAMFDSSHFPNGSTVEMSMKCILVPLNPDGTFGAPFTQTSQSRGVTFFAPAKNSAISHDWATTGGVSAAMNCFTATGYAKTSISGSGWSDASYLAELEGRTVTVVGSHGSCPMPELTRFGTPIGTGVTCFDVESTRVSQMGSGYIAQNSTMQPPIYFTFHSACHTATNNNFIRGHYPYINSYNGASCEDGAFTGFAGLFLGTSLWQGKTYSEIITGEFLKRLSEGWTVGKIRDWMIEQAQGHVMPYWKAMDGDAEISILNFKAWGDQFTRLKGAYVPGAESESIGPWFYSLTQPGGGNAGGGTPQL
jgi:hypothetical protein